MSRSVLLIGLIGGSLFLLAGIFSILIWAIAGPIAGVLLGSWFGGEIKKRLDRAGEERMETRVIRFRQKAALESMCLICVAMAGSRNGSRIARPRQGF